MRARKIASVTWILVLLAGLAGCSQVGETVAPAGSSDSGTGNNNAGGGSGPGDVAPVGGFGVAMRATGCGPGLPGQIVIEVQDVRALNDEGEWVSSQASEVPVTVDCSGEAVVLTASGATLPADDYVAIEVTVTGISVEGIPVSLPGVSATILAHASFTVTAEGSFVIELTMDISLSIRVENGEMVFHAGGVESP